MSVAPAVAAVAAILASSNPSGIVCLPAGNNPASPNTTLANDPGWTNPNVKGFMIRDFWPNVEPTEGIYNWSFFDQAVALAAQHGKFLGLAVAAGLYAPPWVYADGAASIMFTESGGAVDTMPLPWDAVFQAKWFALVQAMGSRYAGNPSVAYICMTGPGRNFEMYMVYSAADAARFDVMNGQALWGQAVGTIASAYAKAFPRQALIYAIAPPTMDAQGRATVKTAVNAAMAEYPGHVGACADELVPNYAPTSASGLILEAASGTNPVGFQMLDPMTGLTGTLAQALTAAEGFKAHYVEVYTGDCADPAQQSTLNAADGVLK
jgi:hypothetical protein